MRLLAVKFIITIYCCGIWCRLEPIPGGLLATRSSLAKCIGQATELFFHEDEILLVSVSTSESLNILKSAVAMEALLFAELFKRSSLSIIIKKTSNPISNEFYMKPIDNYILHVRNPKEVKANLNILRAYPTWNPHAKFMVISAAILANPDDGANIIIKELSSVNVVNGVVLLPNPENTTVFDVYSWFPFSAGRCLNSVNIIDIIDKCSFGQLYDKINWFPNKVPRNLNGCLFRVRAIVWPPYVLPPVVKDLDNITQYHLEEGLEVKILNTMADIANFSIMYTLSNKLQDWGTVYKNGTATGSLLFLKNLECDIVIGSYAATADRMSYFDAVTYNIPESLTWCVPHAGDTDHWKKLLMVIPMDIWYWSTVVFLFISFCLWIFSHFEINESTSYQTFPSSMQNTFSVLVNMAVKVQPRSSKVRFLFLIWAFVTLNISAVYQTSLISVLTKPKYNQKIKTVYDIIERNMDMWFLPNTKRYFREKNDWMSSKIMEQWHDCNDIGKCLNKTAFERTSVTCTPRLYMKYAVNYYVSKNGNPLLYCFKESVVTYPLEMMLAKGFPLKSYFSILIGRITAAGLVANWEKQMFDFQFRSRSKAVVQKSEDSKLAISHLELIFVILIVGNLCACILFILELYVYKRKLVKRKKNLGD